jgi:hypothetical protein
MESSKEEKEGTIDEVELTSLLVGRHITPRHSGEGSVEQTTGDVMALRLHSNLSSYSNMEDDGGKKLKRQRPKPSSPVSDLNEIIVLDSSPSHETSPLVQRGEGSCTDHNADACISASAQSALGRSMLNSENSCSSRGVSSKANERRRSARKKESRHLITSPDRQQDTVKKHQRCVRVYHAYVSMNDIKVIYFLF